MTTKQIIGLAIIATAGFLGYKYWKKTQDTAAVEEAKTTGLAATGFAAETPTSTVIPKNQILPGEIAVKMPTVFTETANDVFTKAHISVPERSLSDFEIM